MAVFNALTGNRTTRPVSRHSKRKCPCCGNKATLVLVVDGCAMGESCELYAKRWVKNARDALALLYRLKERRAALERIKP